LHVIRFWNCDVLQEIDSVIEAIYAALGQKPAPSPGALKRQRTPVSSSRARRPLPEGRGEGATVEKANQQ
jgi:hypothetical protein